MQRPVRGPRYGAHVRTCGVRRSRVRECDARRAESEVQSPEHEGPGCAHRTQHSALSNLEPSTSHSAHRPHFGPSHLALTSTRTSAFALRCLPAEFLHRREQPIVRQRRYTHAISTFHGLGCEERVEDRFFGGLHRRLKHPFIRAFGSISTRERSRSLATLGLAVENARKISPEELLPNPPIRPTPSDDARGHALELMWQEGRVRRGNHDDRSDVAELGCALPRRGARRWAAAVCSCHTGSARQQVGYFFTNRHATDTQPRTRAVVALHEYADGESAIGRR